MNHSWIAAVALLSTLISPLAAESQETLAQWSSNFSTPLIQYKVLDRIFPGQIGNLREAKRHQDGKSYFFPKGGMWARLSPASANGKNFLIVSCMVYQNYDRRPISAVTYLFRDTTSRPVTLTGGYSANEESHTISLAQLGRSFLLIVSSSNGGHDVQWGATLYEIADPMSSRPRTVWTNPRSRWRFQLGFVTLGQHEALVFKDLQSSNEPAYTAFRWDGNKFEEDDFVSESTLKNLPQSIWMYGEPQAN